MTVRAGVCENRRSGCKPGCGCIALVPVLVLIGGFVLVAGASRCGLQGNEVAYLGAGIIISLLFPALAFAAGLGLGVLWAPFAALTCARVARSRGLDRRKYALAGAVYSILFFWPWVYLVTRLYGRKIPGPVIRGAYVLLYGVIWPSSALSFIPLAFSPQPFGVVSVFLLMLSIGTWLISFRGFNWSGINGKGHVRTDPSDEVMPDSSYVMPFAYVFGWITLIVCFWWLSGFRTA